MSSPRATCGSAACRPRRSCYAAQQVVQGPGPDAFGYATRASTTNGATSLARALFLAAAARTLRQAMSADEHGSSRALNALAAAAAVATILGFVLALVGWPGEGGSPDRNGEPAGEVDGSGPFAVCDPAEISLSRGRGPSGTMVTVSGSGFAADREVDLRFHTFRLPPAGPGADGTFQVDVRIPGDLDAFAPQQFDIIASGPGVGCSDSAPFQLTTGD